jgi:hypothetical protein
MFSPFTWLLLTVLFAVPQTVHPTTEAPLEPYDVKEAYEVYAAILPDDWTWRVAHSTTLAILSETVAYKMCLDPDKESQSLLRSAIDDYITLNKKKWALQRQFEIEKPYELIAPEETWTSWETFGKRHKGSNGWIELSAVGFNADKTIAIVYSGHHCGWLCGGGGFALLQKTDGKWQPLKWKGNACAWMS